jgi:hypothetical protein
MSQPLFYCSELSARSGERAFGTASTGAVWLLVEYPFAWGSRAMESSALAPAIKERLAALLKTIPRSRLLFIKQDPLCRDDFNFFGVRSRERAPYAVRLRLTDYKDLLGVNVARIAAGDSTEGGELSREPLFLVCTHGKRDKCCAKFGNPLYKSLRASDAAPSVWQSSHVGGDRFAANLVCFPHGLFYARVSEEAGARAAAEYARGRIVLENFRGRACFAHPVQAAEYFVRAETGLVGLDDLRLAGRERAGALAWRVRFAATAAGGKVYEATVTSRASEFQNFITCHAAEERRVTEFVLDALGVADAPSGGA